MPQGFSHCSLENEHIGKSSSGWKFCFSGATGKKCWDDWKRDLESGEIIDEYDQPISFEMFVRLVESKKHLRSHHEYCLENLAHENRRTWFDKYNNDFSGYEFS